jgi:hypothetical protein
MTIVSFYTPETRLVIPRRPARCELEANRDFRESITRPTVLGGDMRDRTADLLLAKQSLSQLSYVPKLVRDERVELPTSSV